MVHRPHPAFVLFLDSLQAKSGPAGACSVLSAHDNMALAQDSIGWAAWRGRGQRELSGPSPPGMVLSHPLAPPHQLQGALSGLQGCPDGPGPSGPGVPDTLACSHHMASLARPCHTSFRDYSVTAKEASFSMAGGPATGSYCPA